ncbi:putative zinc finger protein [Orchesella cincta]|uniref:Putative zinc finger protein n=1 Tax=Orchesella cincta TaxID=48709 RepID=A0A1D2M821_ORCCI|nr:putative zinc finger protein [Orchesella cincta]
MGYECTTCSEIVPLLKRIRKQESLFRQHYLSSHSQRYSCRLCPETPNCSDRKGLFKHLEETHGISTMVRYQNAIKFSKSGKYLKANRTCEICGMPWTNLDGRRLGYKAHLQTHMNDEEKKEAVLLDAPQYKQLSSIPSSSSTSGSINICESCGMFITNGESGMRHHIKDSHPELEEPSVKPFLCTICGVSLSCLASLHNHTRKKHPDGKSDERFKCKFPSCPANLSDEPSLKEHVEGEHGQSEEARNGVLCELVGG